MLEEMLDKWRRGTTGPLPQLTPLRLLNALLLIDQEGPVGRRALAQALSINDGIARGLLERLAEQEIVSVTKNGAKLSQQGKNRLHTLLQKMSVRKILTLGKTSLAGGKPSVAIQLSKKYQPGMTGIPQRDEAVKAGADGSIVMAVLSGKLLLPPDNKDAAELSPADNSRLRETFSLGENDLIVIGFGRDQRRALAGAIAAALSLAPNP